jgi:hypothetical protein
MNICSTAVSQGKPQTGRRPAGELTNIIGARKARMVVEKPRRTRTMRRFFLVRVQVWRINAMMEYRPAQRRAVVNA